MEYLAIFIRVIYDFSECIKYILHCDCATKRSIPLLIFGLRDCLEQYQISKHLSVIIARHSSVLFISRIYTLGINYYCYGRYLYSHTYTKLEVNERIYRKFHNQKLQSLSTAERKSSKHLTTNIWTRTITVSKAASYLFTCEVITMLEPNTQKSSVINKTILRYQGEIIFLYVFLLFFDKVFYWMWFLLAFWLQQNCSN